jgi:hypothetical protein
MGGGIEERSAGWWLGVEAQVARVFHRTGFRPAFQYFDNSTLR